MAPSGVLLLQDSGSLTERPGLDFADCPGGHRAGETWQLEPCVTCTCQVRESEAGPSHHITPGLIWRSGRAAAAAQALSLEPARPASQQGDSVTGSGEGERAQCLLHRQGPCGARGPHAQSSTAWRATPHRESAAPSVGQVTAPPCLAPPSL